MSDMEQIVRPFQSPSTINNNKTITILPKVAKTTSNALEWGQAGAPPTITGLSVNIKKDDKQYKEVPDSRKTTPVRIENPDDPNQYIIEQRINSISFDTKDAFPSGIANQSGTSGGATEQVAYPSGSTDQQLLDSYNALVNQGIDPSVASTMIYGNQYTAGKVQQPQAGFNSNFELEQPST